MANPSSSSEEKSQPAANGDPNPLTPTLSSKGARETEGLALEMRDVAVGAQDATRPPLIDDINWRVAAGDFWVVVSSPGAGKSYLLQTAVGMQPPVKGQVLLFGHPFAEGHESLLLQHRLRLSLLLEWGGRLFGEMTVAQNIALPLRYHRNWTEEEAEEKVRQVVLQTQLDNFADRLPGDLPRSLRVKVGLARALVTSPDLLLLDNPLRGLDAHQIRWWIDFVAGLAKEYRGASGLPLALIVTTDHLTIWRDIGQHFAQIRQGRWHSLDASAALPEAPPQSPDEWGEL